VIEKVSGGVSGSVWLVGWIKLYPNQPLLLLVTTTDYQPLTTPYPYTCHYAYTTTRVQGE
jgi:hypothetical protein